tara:strand:- start:655 stop:927 length:273 start_codon:yes stop_codon:yes gene_type:complete
MSKAKQYKKTYTVQGGKSVGELGSPTRWPEAWFSKRHIIAPNSRIGGMRQSDFPLKRVFADNPTAEEKARIVVKESIIKRLWRKFKRNGK